MGWVSDRPVEHTQQKLTQVTPRVISLPSLWLSLMAKALGKGLGVRMTKKGTCSSTVGDSDCLLSNKL